MHIAEDQAQREGVDITFPMLFSSCVFAGNALTTVGQATPYQCVYGRQPPMLPDIEMPGFEQ